MNNLLLLFARISSNRFFAMFDFSAIDSPCNGIQEGMVVDSMQVYHRKSTLR